MFPSDVDSWDNLGNTCRQLRNLKTFVAPISLGLLETFEEEKKKTFNSMPIYWIFKRTDYPSQGREYDPRILK